MLIVKRCALTETALERMVGLLRHKKLGSEEGLWIESCNSIHTFFMRFPIDAVFLDANGVVLRIYKNLSPWRMSGLHWRARSVLELCAGSTDRLNLQTGEALELCK